MKTLVFGKNGQIGQALHEMWKDRGDIVFLARDDCDLSNLDQLQQVLEYYQPNCIINAAAYTAVDRAEVEIDLANSINADAPKLMARYLSRSPSSVFIHYSTDYVFGDSQSDPYAEDDPVDIHTCLNVYGKSKLQGEINITQEYEHLSGDDLSKDQKSVYIILRTSWVYGDGDNFLKTVLRLAREREGLNIIADQIGAPTSADLLAKITAELLCIKLQSKKLASGIYHAVPHGSTSWHGLASFIVESSKEQAMTSLLDSSVIYPIPASDYASVAVRPYNSRLRNEKLVKYLNSQSASLQIGHWQKDVEKYLAIIADKYVS